jgi:hypothetical protein
VIPAAAERPWVLVADGSVRPGGQGRAAVAAVRALGRGGYKAAVTVSDRSSLAAASRYCGRTVPVPRITDPGFADAVRAELERHPYLTCLAASDQVLEALDAPVGHLLDKVELARRADEAGVPVPPSRVFSSPEELAVAAEELDYPVVVKPVVHRYTPYRASSPAELTAKILGDGEIIIQPFVDEPIRMVSGVMWGDRLVGAVHQRWLRSWKPVTGNASAAVTTESDPELEGCLETLLRGYEGVFNAQLIGPYLLDVHPRVYGTHVLAEAAGANLIALWCDLLRGLKVTPPRARPGVLYRWIEGDLRHVYEGLRSGRLSLPAALRIAAPRRGTAHSTESLSDPGPMLKRAWYSLRRAHIPEESRRRLLPGRG